MGFDPPSYPFESTLPLFRNNTPVPLFLFRVRTAQQSQTRSLFASTVLDLPVGCAKLVYFCYKFIFHCLVATLKGKAVVKIGMQSIWKTYNCRKIAEACKEKKQFQVCKPLQSVSLQYVCILVLQHQDKWMFLVGTDAPG